MKAQNVKVRRDKTVSSTKHRAKRAKGRNGEDRRCGRNLILVTREGREPTDRKNFEKNET